MTTLMETASINIKHDRVENKIAGIMMFNNIFSSGGRASAKVVEWIYQFVPIELVIQMVQTESNEKSVAIQSAALNFLVYSCESSPIARSLLAFVSKLCDVFVKTKRTEFKSQLGTFLKLLALVSGSEGKVKIINALLEATHNEKSTDSLSVLNLLVEVASTPSTDHQEGQNSKKKAENLNSIMHTLTPVHCGVLRSLVMQGLHGAAPQTTRDATFLCVKQLLTWSPDSTDNTGNRIQYDISPAWTWSVENPASATFPMFLCSILRSELQLLCDELLFLAINSAETVAERFNLTISAKATVPASMGATKSAGDSAVPVTGAGAAANDSGDIDGTATGEKAETDTDTANAESVPAVDPAIALQRKITADIRYFQSRVARTHAMYLTCLQLVDCVLNLLIGEKETVTDSRWSTLPGESLLSIKKVLYSMLNDLFEFLIDCAERLKEIESEANNEVGGVHAGSGESSLFTAASSLRSVACCTLDTMSRFLEQDNELMEVFVKCVPKLLTISHARKGGEVSAGVATECLVQALVGYESGSNSMEDSKQRWVELLAYDPAATTPTVTTSNTSNTATSTTTASTSDNTTTNNTTTNAYNVFHCELYMHLVEPVRTLIFLGNTNDLFPTTYDALVDCVSLLLPQLVGLLNFIFGLIRSSISTDGAGISSNSDVRNSSSGTYPKRSLLVSAGLPFLWLLQDLLTIQQGKHLAETKLLMRGEGPSVLVSMLGIEASVLVEFAQTLRMIAAQLNAHQTEWLADATTRQCEETSAFVLASLQIAETMDGLFGGPVGVAEDPCCNVL